jgi:serine/threonine-protein kinase
VSFRADPGHISDHGSEQPSRRRAWGWLLVSLALLLAAGAFVALDVRKYFTVTEITLPNLVGMPFEQAAATLRREGLDPVTFVEHVANLPAEVVSSQAPEPGTVVKRSRSVHLGVNTPPAASLVPDLVGLLQSDALDRADELNLPVGTITFQPSDRASGRVIAQSPAGGERLGEARLLELVVSSGPAVAMIQIPELAGTNVEDAEIALRALGFRLVEKLPSAVSFVGPGAVVSTIPAAGEEVAYSTPIILQYALSTANVVRIPEVIGLPQWRAQLALRAAQLDVGEVTYVQDPNLPDGVVDVKPTGYTLPGTPVLLTINGTEPTPLFPNEQFGGFLEGLTQPGQTTPGGTGSQGSLPGGAGSQGTDLPADGSRQVSFSFDPTNMGIRRLLEEQYQLKVVVADERGERVVLDRSLNPGQTVSTTIPVYGPDVMLQTFIDDVFFQAWRP